MSKSLCEFGFVLTKAHLGKKQKRKQSKTTKTKPPPEAGGHRKEVLLMKRIVYLIVAVCFLTALLAIASVQSVAATQDTQDQKILICHVPPGNPDNARVIEVAHSSWEGHAKHGDCHAPGANVGDRCSCTW